MFQSWIRSSILCCQELTFPLERVSSIKYLYTMSWLLKQLYRPSQCCGTLRIYKQWRHSGKSRCFFKIGLKFRNQVIGIMLWPLTNYENPIFSRQPIICRAYASRILKGWLQEVLFDFVKRLARRSHQIFWKNKFLKWNYGVKMLQLRL